MASRDITEGRATRAIAVDLGVNSPSSIWSNTKFFYNVAIGGQPFVLATNDNRPYERVTAPFSKDQVDNSQEPGEQSLAGWWMRSQTSFHSGMGITYFDPISNSSFNTRRNPLEHYRFNDSLNVDVWTKGQVTLLKATANLAGVTTGIYKIKSIISGATDKILAWIPGSTTLKEFDNAGTAVTYSTMARGNIVDVTTDGSRVFVADATRIFVGNIGDTAAMTGYYVTGSSAVVIEWVKQRLVACVGTSVYELTGAIAPTALPTALYTHPNTSWLWTSITEGGTAIYVAGYAGGISAIYKFTLNTSGAMPTLTSGIIAARLPYGEVVHRIEEYLGYMVIGTSKGVRIANISDQDGSLTYGPLIIETTNPVKDFTFRDRFVYVANTVETFVGLFRIDLSVELETLRFAYASDANFTDVVGYATSVDFFGNGTQLAYTPSTSNGIAVQSTTVLAASGYLTTGNIRYGTLEPKNFKRLLGRGSFTYGSLVLNTLTSDDVLYDHVTYNSETPSTEVNTVNPQTAQEYVAYRFDFTRDTTDTTQGPVFKGYQAKATIATPRHEIIKFFVYCFDEEIDKFNVKIGYKGRGKDKFDALKAIEINGDVLSYQDFDNGETLQVIIEEVDYIGLTPPDKASTGFGGVLHITLRTV